MPGYDYTVPLSQKGYLIMCVRLSVVAHSIVIGNARASNRRVGDIKEALTRNFLYDLL